MSPGPGDAVERHVNPPRGLFFHRFGGAADRRFAAVSVVSRRRGSDHTNRARGLGVEAATRSPMSLAVAGCVVGDAPERSGSENRHDAVRVSKSQ